MVVCGGFHLFLDREDREPPPALPAGTVYTAVVPYSYPRCAESSGYGAGNRAPRFYQAAKKAGIKALEGAEFESITTKVSMAISKGHQAVTEDRWGVTKWDDARGEMVVTDVEVFPGSCIMPPEGVNSVEWLKGGMKGAKCNWHWDEDTEQAYQPENSYAHPQGSACFIQSVDDNMESIMELARISPLSPINAVKLAIKNAFVACRWESLK